jgi:hypothetical protein
MQTMVSSRVICTRHTRLLVEFLRFPANHINPNPNPVVSQDFGGVKQQTPP